MPHSPRFPTYEAIGVRPLINCMGTFTVISGSLLLPEVREAMATASTRYVHIDELMEAVGARIAGLMQCGGALVTSGCAAALCQITAACVAGQDPELIERLPDTTGMKNEVIIPAFHRHAYEHAIRMTGVRMIEVRNRAELAAAIGPKTAMLAVFGDAVDRGGIPVREMVHLAAPHGVPVFVDAAAERPDVPNRYLAEGASAVAYSGGKCLRGPQASGLLLGRRDLLQAAYRNGPPHHALGRPMKVGKEEIMGLLAAIEQWGQRDHAAEWSEWERRLAVITDAVSPFPTVSTSIRQPERSNVAPVLVVTWDPHALGITGVELKQQLSAGEPRIELFAREDGFRVMPYMMEEGEDQIVARRCGEIFAAAVRSMGGVIR
jgi:L-seryl-tRNA(Ser) seleniumtransferase